MRQCVYAQYAMKHPQTGDICIMCDPMVNAPYDMLIPTYEKNCKAEYRDINKGECLGVCPMEQWDWDAESWWERFPDNERRPNDSMLYLLFGMTLGLTEEEIDDLIENVTNDQIEQAKKEGLAYVKEHGIPEDCKKAK